jgi:hypothetical protein
MLRTRNDKNAPRFHIARERQNKEKKTCTAAFFFLNRRKAKRKRLVKVAMSGGKL